ncbi:MAG: hypothetical protein WC472_03880 [Candidatus Paceibacterota bacterium]
MNVKPIKNTRKVIIGFQIEPKECSGEEFFIMDLPRNLSEGMADIQVEGTQIIIISNGEEYRVETGKRVANAIKKYLEDGKAFLKIELKPRLAIITFVRGASILQAVK